jgi:NAD-dependent deacetylase
VTVLTGAGISTDSGIRDPRPNGVWTKNPKAERTSSIGTTCRPRGAAAGGRGGSTGSSSPARPCRAPGRCRSSSGNVAGLVTQNIDGLHQAAGSSPDRIVEIHGTVHEAVCLSCGRRTPMDETLDRVRAGDADPACLVCGGMLKSATISFGQSLVEADLDRSFDAAAACDVLLAIGSTLGVYPVAAMVPTAKQAGARIVIVNAALAPTRGEGSLQHTSDGSWGYSLYEDAADATGSERVRLETLAEILGDDRPDVVKSNAEGAEFALIEQLAQSTFAHS